MYQRIVFCIISLFLLSSCADGFRSYFKKSANNKLFDTKGFQGDKRLPLYNQKYIAKAKRNIASNESDFDDEEDEDIEYKIPSRVYRKMYYDMLAAERGRKKEQFERRRTPHLSNYRYEDDDYPSLQQANKRVNAVATPNHQSLEKEIREMKSMLKQTQEELTKYKCGGALSSISHEQIIKPIISLKKHARTNLQKRFIDQASL